MGSNFLFMSERISREQLRQPTQQLTPARVDEARLRNNEGFIQAFRYGITRVREKIQALTRRFGEWFATIHFFEKLAL